MGRKNRLTLLIEELIPLLHKEEDAVLIGLLESTMIGYYEERKEYLLSQNKVNRKEMDAAKYGMRETLKYLKLPEPPDWVNKIEKILERTCDCDTCRFMNNCVEYVLTEKGCYPITDERRERCYQRQDYLTTIQFNFFRERNEYIEQIIFTDDFLRLKAIINKLKTKYYGQRARDNYRKKHGF